MCVTGAIKRAGALNHVRIAFCLPLYSMVMRYFFTLMLSLCLAAAAHEDSVWLGIDWATATPAEVTGININARDAPHNATPLHYAAWKNEDPAVMQALLQAGGDVHARNKEGDTPLHLAAWYNKNPAVIEVLLQAGGEVDTRNSEGDYTPLHYAAGYNENPAVVELLLEAGGDIRARDLLYSTPLHWAAEYNGSPEVTKVLLKAGANPAIRDVFSKTPLDYVQKGSEVYWLLKGLEVSKVFPYRRAKHSAG